MPWKKKDIVEQRCELVKQILAGSVPVMELCRKGRISRQTAYKWLRRYRRARYRGLRDKPRKPLCLRGKTKPLWLRRIRRARKKRPTWGARKLWQLLSEKYGRRGAPSATTINRWLKKWGLARGRPRRRRGPVILRKPLHKPKSSHEVWTVDFKGWFRAGDGSKVLPLTVRDLFSRYGLAVTSLRTNGLAETRREFERLFKKHGIPERIRCDNGIPFGGGGPAGLTQLSVWWVKLGIEVEFITPGCPYQNGSHEQFHRVYKAEAAKNPQCNGRLQEQENSRWLRDYNTRRPHQGLGMKRPAELFKKNRRRMPKKLKPWKYPKGWEVRRVKRNGEISWQGEKRLVGGAFAREQVGMKKIREGVWRVYFRQILVGVLHENEKGSVRLAKYRRAR
jgi:transposase InsO family protein